MMLSAQAVESSWIITTIRYTVVGDKQLSIKMRGKCHEIFVGASTLAVYDRKVCPSRVCVTFRISH